MNPIRQAVRRLVRGRAACRLLRLFGIDPKRYWLLIDLFGELSERGEMLDQLGNNEIAMKTAAWIYFVVSALVSVGMLAAQLPRARYESTFLFMTGFLMLVVLLGEAGNSLVNPVEGLVLAHQPIDGATYSAAKLSHLGKIVLYFVPGLNGFPAVAGLLLKDASWYYPLVHMAAALALGYLVALLCCAVFGWLIRFFPTRRLKAAAQLAAAIPFLAMPFMGSFATLAFLDPRRFLPDRAAIHWGFGIACAATAIVIAALGIRALSADYLLRVSTVMRGGTAAGAKSRRSRFGDLVARFFGGQASRAAFAYVSQMMRRDYQFRRQLIGVVFLPIMMGSLLIKGMRIDPFSGKFTAMHLVPHLLGGALCLVCLALPYGSDYKGAWLFLTVPTRAFGPFVRGVYALLWISLVIIPSVVLIAPLVWFWTAWHAGLFLAYNLAAGSVYAALALRLIETVPFTRQMDMTRGAAQVPMMFLGLFAMGIVVGLQYIFVFRSPAVVLLTAVAVGASAVFLTRRSLTAFENSIRYNLGLISEESGLLYKEIVA